MKNAVLKDSTTDNPLTVENGVEGDLITVDNRPEYYAELYERESINERIIESQK